MVLGTACSRKTIPQKQSSSAEKINNGNADENAITPVGKIDSSTIAVATVVPRKTVAITTPKFITLNDAVAKKAVDGRLYYDLEGKRYWKNYKDGKYYLYNKNMNGNPDYKPRN